MVLTYKEKFNKKYGFTPSSSHSIGDISKITNYKKSGLQTIFNKGVGAFKTNPASVRPSVKSADQWAAARLYSAVMGGKAAKVDATNLIKK